MTVQELLGLMVWRFRVKPRLSFKGFLKGVSKGSIVGFYNIGAEIITSTIGGWSLGSAF